MKKALLLLAIVLGMSLQLYCVNHMDLLTTMTGEHNKAHMGSSMASLDFNGDGYDDLVVSSSAWGSNQPPDSTRYGKIYFYWGGPGFDNIPDMTLAGTYYGEYAANVYNLGDINGDGFDDLGVSHSAIQTGLDPGNPKFSIFYGGQVPDTQPDYSFELNYYQYGGIVAEALGDINGDGFDDIGLLIWHGGTNLYRVMLGGSLQNVDLFEAGQHNYASFFHGLGDINNDGFDDFSIGHYANGNQQVTIYYGSAQINIQNSLSLYHAPNFILTSSCRAGDVNGDSFDDIIGYENAGTLKFWYGDADITPSYDLLLSPYLAGHNSDEGIRCGDLNNDGYSDILGTYPTFDWNNGMAGFWLGGQSFNATLDYTFEPPAELNQCNFGDVSVTGDFNGDGCCDYAIAAPTTELTWFPFNGKVYVYAGNSELDDTTPVDDEVITQPDTSLWSISVYPNPMKQNKSDINIRFTGKGYKQPMKLIVSIYNIKGQVIKTSKVSRKELLDYTYVFKLKRVVPGKYIISVSEGNRELANQQVSIY